MKKQFIKITIGTFIFIPLFVYAESKSEGVVPTVTQTIQTSVEVPIKEDKEKTKEVFDNDTSSTTETDKEKTFTECSQEAIEARDTKIASTRAVYNTAMANALTDRKNKEKAAVAMKSEAAKKDAMKLSVDTYKNQVKVAQNTLTQARKLAWQSFENDIQACRDIEDSENADKNDEITADSKDDKVKMFDDTETKTFRDTIKSGFDTLKALFN